MEHLIILQVLNELKRYFDKADKNEVRNTVKFLTPILAVYKSQIEEDLRIAQNNSFEALQSDNGFSRETEMICNEEENLLVLKNCLNNFLGLGAEVE